MSTRRERTSTPDIRALELMLDYAIVEGAELRLPRFVLLLRAAQLELTASLAPGGDHAERETGPRCNESTSLAPPGKRLDDFAPTSHDW
jgi:hypothetical protein